MNSPMMLVVMDGFGLREETEGNAIKAADTPVLDELFSTCPWSKIKTSGEGAGLPEGQMGNSEVGHMNLGAGRVVYQPLTRIHKAIEDGDFFENEELVTAVEKAKENNGTLHLIGLLSDGGVHSHQKHLNALLKLAGRHGLDDVAVHAQLDGRDVPPRSADKYLAKLKEDLKEIGTGEVATIGGRYFGMDRDTRWDRTERAYKAIVNGESEIRETDPVEAIEHAYEERDENDEFVQPTVFVDDNGEPRATVEDGDAVIFFNFRPDRARQLTRAMTEPGFDKFPVRDLDIHFVCMAQFDENFDLPIAYPPLELENILAEYLSDQGLTQFHTSETEKYAHVTFFFNGGREKPFPGEERKLIPSPDVSTYEKKPEMSAYKVTDNLVERLAEKDDNFIIINFANGDMVGHTGYFDAAVEAVETVDECVGRLREAMAAKNGQMLITADHGNAEIMHDETTDGPHTAHSLSLTPLIYVGSREIKLKDGILGDIAPTILELMELPVPAEMTGNSLVERV